MTNHMAKGFLAARTFALAAAAIGVCVGPGGVAAATAPHVVAASGMRSLEGTTLASRSPVAGRALVACDDPDSGDGGDGDDDTGDDD